jgi:hypothetical protein
MSNSAADAPSCVFTHAAFRAGFLSVFDSLLRYSVEGSSDDLQFRGLFEHYPLLNAVAPQVQLDCLLRSWSRWQSGHEPDALDQCVTHACREKLIEHSDAGNQRYLNVILSGPQGEPLREDFWLGTRLRCLQLGSHPSGQGCVVRQMVSGPENRALNSEFAEDVELLDLIGQWRARREVIFCSTDLLTPDEQDLLLAFFEEHPGLVR